MLPSMMGPFRSGRIIMLIITAFAQATTGRLDYDIIYVSREAHLSKQNKFALSYKMRFCK